MQITSETVRSKTAATICLSIAGSDSSGGAGIQADLKAFSALGVYGATVITAVTAQNTRTVSAICEIPPDVVASQISAVLEDLNVAAIKIGMLFSPEIIQAVARSISGVECPVVLDPVMVAKSGGSLLGDSALPALRELLVPKATVITPNLPEAARLLGCGEARNEADVESQGRALLELGAAAVLMKGGHATGASCVDVMITRGATPVRISAPRFDTPHTHGTGCTMSSAIAAGLAKGRSLSEAFKEAHAYLQGAIHSGPGLCVGSGRGPVHHFYRTWN